MKYLVIHDLGIFTGINIVPGGKTYPNPIACWALDDGKKMEYATLLMGRHLSKFYVSGTYQQMALYALTFDELRLILSKPMGPDDEMRYLALKAEQDGIIKPKFDWTPVIIGSCELFLKVMWGIVKLMAVVILIPFVINFLKNRKHNK